MRKPILFAFLALPLILLGQEAPKSNAERLSAAQTLLDQKKPEEAIALLKGIQEPSNSLSKKEDIQVHQMLGLSHMSLKQYENAIEDYTWTLTNTEGNDTLQAIAHSQLGMNYLQLTRYTSAFEHTRQAADLYRKIYGTDHKSYVASLNSLGFIYKAQAKYNEAEKTLLEARELNVRITKGKGDLQYARIINNLADVYVKLNRFDQADTLYQNSLLIKEKISGKQSKDYTNTLFNIAGFQANLGRPEKAISTIMEGIGIFYALKDTNNPDFLKFLDYQAILTEQMGDIPGAERRYKEIIARREGAGATKQADYALNLLNLGRLYAEQGKPDAALPYVEQALSLGSTIYGKTHPTYANILTTLAEIQSKQGKNDLAKGNYETAVGIILAALGKDHIEYFNAQFSYARFLRRIGKTAEAIEIYKSIYKIPPGYLKRAACFLSEKEINDKIEAFRYFSLEIYSFIRQLPNDTNLNVIAYNTTLYYRGFILVNLQKIRQGLQKTRKGSDTWDELVSLQRQLDNELNKPVEERANTVELEKKIGELQIKISRAVRTFNNDDSRVSWKDVRKSLGSKEAAVEYVSFADPYAGDSIFYGALFLTHTAKKPLFIPLCRESDFAALLPVNATRQGDYVNRIYNFSNRGIVPTGQEPVSLVDLVWRPISQHLNGIERIYVVPDGLLHRIALSALPTSLETVVADSIELVVLGSSWQVVPNDNKRSKLAGNQSLVVGGIDYGLKSAAEGATRSGVSGVGNQNWQALPWAEKESQEVAKLLQGAAYQVSYLDRKNASEKSVVDSLENKAGGWRVLHMATHGYFSPKAETDKDHETGFYGGGMLNSGLVLAGVNEKAPGTEAADDGLLTAYEVSLLDLSQTELVVLSACETALGDIKGQEGVYGLQRAFKLAGAKYLLMSLWEVPDRETKAFMVSFYKNWLGGKSSVREAFNKTQTEIRQQFYNPYQWAGFILLE